MVNYLLSKRTTGQKVSGMIFGVVFFVGLLIFSLFVSHLIIPENFGIFKIIKSIMVFILTLGLYNYIVKNLWAKYIFLSILLVWVIDAILLGIFMVTS